MKGTFNVVGFEEVVETNLDNSFNEESYNYEKLKESIDLKIKQLKLDIENIDLDDYVYMDDDSHYSDQMFKRGLVGRVNDEIKDLNDKKDKPYKFRMAILYPDDNLIEDVYIGNKDYMDTQNNIKIFSWWSQLGNKVYDDINTEWIINGQIARLQLKRQIDIENGKLIDVSEIFNIKNGSTFNIVAKDEYLKKILKKKHENKELSNIIASIQYNQNKIITSSYNTNMVMQGCAGCGKTMVLFHRLKFLIANNIQSNNSTYIITPSKLFNKHIQPLIKDLELENISIFTIEEYYNKVMSAFTNSKWYLLFRKKNYFDVNPIQLKSDSDLPKEVVEYYYSDDFFNKVDKLEKITKRELRKSEIYKNKKNVNTDKDIDIMNVLLGVKELKLIPEYKRKHGILHKCELYALCLFMFKIHSEKKIYKYINIDLLMVDEAQDISINEYRLLKSLHGANLTFNLFGDIGQSTTSYGIKDWENLRNHIGNVVVYEFNKNYRNPNEIIEFVNKTCNKKMESIGYESYKVTYIDKSELPKKFRRDQLERKAIICSEHYKNELMQLGKTDCVYSVPEIKGIEFNSVYVLLDNMTENEKYIALTRSLEKLTIIK